MFFNDEKYKVEVGSKYKYFSSKNKAIEFFEKHKYGAESVFLYELDKNTYKPIDSWINERRIIFNRFM